MSQQKCLKLKCKQKKKKERKKHTNSPEKNIQEVWDNF